ncbi:hypothetical protein KKF05_00855 [Patescibacteria group bacterium]|nr:hypothetical protein [Patescibacteria group bacterium]MBU1915800.1 hypothetical protein [Patescibacteria group bacterium]
MNAGLINRLINLVRKTGHRVVFGDPETGQAVVVMDLAEYERLIGLDQPVDAPSGPEPYAPEVVGWQGSESAAKPVNQPAHLRPHQVPDTANGFGSRAGQLSASSPVVQSSPQNLTSKEQPAKINREIGGQESGTGRFWQEDDRPPERTPNNPVNQTTSQNPGSSQGRLSSTVPANLDDEERFYLEPLE